MSPSHTRNNERQSAGPLLGVRRVADHAHNALDYLANRFTASCSRETHLGPHRLMSISSNHLILSEVAPRRGEPGRCRVGASGGAFGNGGGAGLGRGLGFFI